MSSSTTRLEAINIILSAAGESPVSSLTANSGVDSLMAEQILTETEKAVQAIGWRFNTRKITFQPDTNGYINLPGGIIRLDMNDLGATHLTIRSNRLYDMVNGSYIFTQAVTGDFVEMLPWDDIPEAAKQYITKKAARIFVDRTVSDPVTANLSRQDEAEALAAIQREEIQTGNYRVFAPEFVNIIDRGKPLDWVTGSW